MLTFIRLKTKTQLGNMQNRTIKNSKYDKYDSVICQLYVSLCLGEIKVVACSACTRASTCTTTCAFSTNETKNVTHCIYLRVSHSPKKNS